MTKTNLKDISAASSPTLHSEAVQQNNVFAPQEGAPTELKTRSRNKRKRVLAFSEIDDPVIVEQTKKYIQEMKVEVKGKSLVSVQEWCNSKGLETVPMTRLLKESDYPLIRIGEYQGAYPEHLARVLEEEADRQLQQQIQNRVCAKLLAQRQLEMKNKTKCKNVGMQTQKS